MTTDILDLVAQRKSKGEPFALATVVRTLDVTAAKAGAKALIAVDLADGTQHSIASGLPLGAPPGVVPKPLKGMPPFSGPQGPFAGIAAGPDGTVYVSADAEGSVLALRQDDLDG